MKQEMLLLPSLEKNDNVVGNGEEVVVNDDDILGEEGDADGDDGDETDGDTKHIRFRTPIKSSWIPPFIKDEIAARPTMSNREMKNLIADYVECKFITTSILQNSMSLARANIFGDPFANVFSMQMP